MHLANKLLVVVIFSILVSKVICVQQCCKNNGTLKDATNKKCRDNSTMSVKCDGYLLMLNSNWGLSHQFIVGTDDKGEYLDAFVMGSLTREPNFCLGYYWSPFLNRTSRVAVVCSSFREFYRDQNLNGSAEAKEEAKDEIRKIRIYNIISSLLNAGSIISFLGIAAIYLFLPEVQDLQGTCYFHFSSIAGLGHLTYLYIEIFETDGLLPNMCITNLYFMMYFLLCGFMWMGVTSFNTWRNTRNIHPEDEEKLTKNYKLFAYGVPFVLLFSCFVHVHVKNISDMEIALACYEHQVIVLEIYVAIPLLLTLLANFFMFIHAQIQIWNQHALQLQNKKLMLKIIKYRFFMNAKLFFLMGVPWFLYIVYALMWSNINSVFSTFFFELLQFLLFGEGIPIFIVLVVFRKRVLRGMANRWLTNTNVFPDKWKTEKDSETEEEEDEEAGGSSTNVQVRYNIQEANGDKSNHNPLPIITF